MLINFNHLKTFGNAICQKMKNFRGNWEQNDPTADDYIKNRTHYVDDNGNVHKLDKKFIDMPDGIVTEETLYPILENNLAPVAFSNNYDSLSGKPTIYTDVVRYGNSQSLTTTQKIRAKSNINAVGYDVQALTDAQKKQARNNIGAGTSDFSGNYNDLTEKPCYDYITYPLCGTALSWTSWTGKNTVSNNCYYCQTTLNNYVEGETYRIEVRKTDDITILYSSDFQAEKRTVEGIESLVFGNEALYSGAYENTGEPILVSKDLRYSGVTVFVDFAVLSGGDKVYIYKKTENFKQLDEKFIPDSVKYGNTEATRTYTWDGNITGKQRATLAGGARVYYKVADINFNINSIINTQCILSSNTNLPVKLYTTDEAYVTYELIISNHTGAFPVYGDSSSVTINVPEPGIYMSYDSTDEYVKSASITYNARSIPSDVVGLVRTINGNEPDVNGNIELNLSASGQVQPDWNQNDETAPDYIKNRTHYDTIGEVYPETTIALEGGSATLPSDFILELNKQYIISWNGTPYTCTAESTTIEGEMAIVVGNIGAVTGTGSDTGEPFVMVYVPSYNMTLVQAIDDSLTSVNLKIENEVAVKLPYKYLPNNLYRSEIEVLLPESTLTFNNADGDINFMEEQLPFTLTEGTTYCVFWNGTPYTAIAQLWNATVVIGNVKGFGGSDTGEPFAVFNGDDGTSVICTVDGSTSANVKIEGEKIIKVPEKYLPDLKNPYSLEFTGAITDTYDGSEAKTVNIVGKAGTGIYAELFNNASGASGACSHAEGLGTYANGDYSHAEGYDTTTDGNYSHSEGYYTIAKGEAQHVQGKCNIEDTQNAHIVGNGTSFRSRSNAHTLDWEGNAWFAGDVYVGSTSGTNKDAGSKKLIAAPTANTGDLLMYDGTNWVALSKSDLIAEIIAAFPSAEGVSF